MELTDWMAVYGAVLSTAVVAWNVRQSRPNLRMRIIHAIEQNDDGSHSTGLRIEVQNPSQHTAHLQAVHLAYPWRKVSLVDAVKHMWRFRALPRHQGWCHTFLSNYGIDDGCPVSIEAQKSHSVFVPDHVLEELSEASTKPTLKAIGQDMLWRNRYSKAFRYR